jgi:Ca2+-binding EF-hand superfamily protein
MTSRNAAEMQKTFKLPLLPGQTCGEELLRTNFRKTQMLSGTGERAIHVKDVPLDFDSTNISATASVGRRTANDTLSKTSPTSAGAGDGLDKKVLRFFGFFDETVTESAVEKSRVRKVTFCYFLEDDTISVSEPRQDNSGIAFQGCMVKRHQIPKPEGGFVHFTDFSVGADISFYGRTFHITDCDAFTREMMASIGIEQADPITVPADTYNETRKAKAKANPVASVATALNASGAKVKLSASEVRAARQFLENDRKVLRLRAVWDDTKSLYGEKHFFTLYYFLSDDTIELVEESSNNSGRDPFPSFCRRQRIIKSRDLNSTALAFGQKEAQQNAEFYSDADLRIGSTIAIFGRTFLIYDYDKFTREHLKERYNVTDYNPMQVAEAAKPRARREPPPYNGYGSEEDSLVSWRSLDMKPPRKDMSDYEKYGDAVVKYSLKLANGNPNDELRRFVLSCFLADSSIAIFETVQRNSGILGGKFLQRQKVVNPETGKAFTAPEFYVGQSIVINKFTFEVLGTDERSLAFMEENSSVFPKSSINAVVEKIQAMLLSSKSGLYREFQSADRSGLALNVANLVGVFKGLRLDVCEQEVMTLLRYFERNGDVNLNFEVLATRLIDSDAAPASDSRTWEQILAERSNADAAGLSVRERVDKQARAVEATTAAYAARTFLDAYQARRHLFHTEFKFITDYAVDNKIGEPEFRAVVRDKLQLPLSDHQIDALVHKVFPAGSRRVTFEEFLRIINNTSNYDHNLDQIKQRRE